LGVQVYGEVETTMEREHQGRGPPASADVRHVLDRPGRARGLDNALGELEVVVQVQSFSPGS